MCARDEAAAALALRNAELHDKRQQRLAESERFGRVLVSLLQKTVLEQVLDIIVCTEAQSLIGATGSALLMRTNEAWLEVKHRLGQPLTTVDRLPVDGSLAGEVMRKGESVRLNDDVVDVVDVGYSNDLAAVLNAAGKVYAYYQYEGGGHNINSPYFEQAMQEERS